MAYFSEKVGLVTIPTTLDDEGYPIPGTPEVEEHYANVQSVTQTEFHSAGLTGIDARYKITMYSSEYAGQTMVMYGGKYFNVYRTYKVKEDRIELYVSEAKSEVPTT